MLPPPVTISLIYVEIPRIVKTAGYTTGSAPLSKLFTQLPGVLVELSVGDQYTNAQENKLVARSAKRRNEAF